MARPLCNEMVEEGEGFTAIYPEGEEEAIAFVSSYVVSAEKQGETFPFAMQYHILKAITGGEAEFEYDGKTYEVTEGGGVSLDGEPVAYASRYTVNPQDSDTFLTRQFKEELLTMQAVGLYKGYASYLYQEHYLKDS